MNLVNALKAVVALIALLRFVVGWWYAVRYVLPEFYRQGRELIEAALSSPPGTAEPPVTRHLDDDVDRSQRASLLARLSRTGMDVDTAEGWLAAWVREASGRGLPRDGRYWGAGWDWIAAERATGRPG